MLNTTNINGVVTYYERVCITSEPEETLVFLHGWSGTSDNWKLNIADLSRRYDCIAIDMPGFGVSSEPHQPWNNQDYARFVKDFTQQLGLNKFVLVGKSFGGRVSISYASTWPETLNALILVAAAGVEQKSLPTKTRILIAKMGKAVLSSLGIKLQESMRRLFYKITGVKPDQSGYKWEVKKIVTDTDLSREATQVNIPTLLIWGTNDKILPLRWGQKLRDLIKNAILVKIPGGHQAHIESSNEFNKAVESFLDTHPSRP